MGKKGNSIQFFKSITDDIKNKVIEDYKNEVNTRDTLKKYNITIHNYYNIINEFKDKLKNPSQNIELQVTTPTTPT